MGRSSPEYKKAYYEANKDKIRESARLRSAKWRRDDPDRARQTRRRFLAKQKGITLEQYESMLKAHENKCAICGEPDVKRELCIDHDHVTGKVRGLLCNACNLNLGKFKDSISLLQSAIDYLRRFQENDNGRN